MTEARVESVTRRALLTRSLGVLVVAGALTALDAAPSHAQPKTAQKLVQYQQTPKNGQECDACLHFVPPDGCKVVDGKINPKGWCALFAPKPKTTK